MRSPFLGEFMGTLVMILLGDGVVAGVLLKRSKAENSGWLVITTAWAFAVLCGIFTALLFGSSAAHLNPAFTVASSLQSSSFSTTSALMIVAQILGAFAGAVLVFIHYLPHWKETDNSDAKRSIFCTAPAIRNLWMNFISEVIGTAVLVLVAGAMSSKLVLSQGAAAGLSPYLVSCLVWGVGLSLGGTTGYAINPARDLGPRLAHAILPIPGKGSSDWSYALIPILGPLTGGILAGLILRWIET